MLDMFKCGVAYCKPTSIPLDQNVKLDVHGGESWRTPLCIKIVDILFYFDISRLELKNILGLESQFM